SAIFRKKLLELTTLLKTNPMVKGIWGSVLLLSRRDLLASASSILLSTAAAAAPTDRKGRVNLVFNSLAYYMAFYPFLNAWKCAAPIEVVKDGVSYSSNSPKGYADSAWGTLLDHDGELVNPLPANTTRMERVFYSSPQDGLPDRFNRIGEPW